MCVFFSVVLFPFLSLFSIEQFLFAARLGFIVAGNALFPERHINGTCFWLSCSKSHCDFQIENWLWIERTFSMPFLNSINNLNWANNSRRWNLRLFLLWLLLLLFTFSLSHEQFFFYVVCPELMHFNHLHQMNERQYTTSWEKDNDRRCGNNNTKSIIDFHELFNNNMCWSCHTLLLHRLYGYMKIKEAELSSKWCRLKWFRAN